MKGESRDGREMNLEGIGDLELRYTLGSSMRAGKGSEGRFLGQMPTVKGS